MEKEVLEIFETAKKAADGGGSSDVERCVDALRRLKDIPITTKLLVDTQVGKRLRSLTKHPHEKIKASATDLKEHWRNAVLEETKKDSKKNHTIKEETSKKIEVKSERTETTKITMISRSETHTAEKKNSEKVIKAEKVETRKIEKVERVPKEEKKEASIQPPKLTSMIKCNVLDRDRIRELVAKALSRVSEESRESDREEVRNLLEEVDACDPIRVAVAVESAMFERLGSSKDEHNAKYRSVNFNLSDSKNIDFRRRVLIGQVKPEEIADMTAEQMASDERKAANRNIKEKALLECERAAAPKASTDQFKCGRCKQRKCTYYQLQTRSADEPMTTFVTCVNCNNHWKFC